MVIRRSHPGDMPQLTAIWLQASLHADESLPAAIWWHRQETVRKQLEKGTDIWVADNENHLVGFIAVKADELLELYVEPCHEGEWLAEALLNTARRSRSTIFHRACVDHLDEIAFYERQGFKIKDRQTHPIWRLEEYIMEYPAS